jgi:hypothetical protein
MDYPTDAQVDYVAGQLRLLAELIEAHRPKRIELHTSSHVREVPHPTRIEHEHAGIDIFGVMVCFDPGVYALPHKENRS